MGDFTHWVTPDVLRLHLREDEVAAYTELYAELAARRLLAVNPLGDGRSDFLLVPQVLTPFKETSLPAVPVHLSPDLRVEEARDCEIFSVRVHNLLVRSGLREFTLAQLAEFGVQGFRQHVRSGAGPTTLLEIDHVLQQAGLSLSGIEPIRAIHGSYQPRVRPEKEYDLTDALRLTPGQLLPLTLTEFSWRIRASGHLSKVLTRIKDQYLDEPKVSDLVGRTAAELEVPGLGPSTVPVLLEIFQELGL